ncbi:thymidine kinase [Peptostreptococcaceae bacterium AGR-M142]
MAKLYFRYGAMNCGKSTALMQVAFNYKERGMDVLIIKPDIDTKGNNNVISRLGIQEEVNILVGKDMDIRTELKLNHNDKKISCLLVDEVQFMKEEQIDQLFEIAVKDNIPVICYGLRTDFLMNGFPGSKRLLLLAHSIEELKTICRCGKKAVLNARKIDGKFVFEGEQIAIDLENNVEYESLCASCYYKYKER